MATDTGLFDFEDLSDREDSEHGSIKAVSLHTKKRDRLCHFATFGNGKFEDAARQLAAEVEALGGVFQEVHCFTELPTAIARDRRWQEHLTKGRNHGYGWWFWKPALVMHLLEQGVLQDDDVLVYGDAGCTIGARSHQAWMLLLRRVLDDGLEASDFVAFHHEHLENQYTKGDTFARFGSSWDSEDFGLSCQIVGGYWLARIGPRTRHLFSQWEKLAEDVSLISDDSSRLLNPAFRENRHDQSLLSMILKSSGLIFEQCNAAHVNSSSRTSEHKPTSFKSRVGIPHLELGIPELRTVVLQDVGWPVTGHPEQPLAAARRCSEGSMETEAFDLTCA